MQNWSENETISNQSCTVQKDWEDVQQICSIINIPSKRVNYESEYWNRVFEARFIEGLKFGLTPNPDLFCNELIKFGKFYDDFVGLKYFDYMATGLGFIYFFLT